MNDDDLFGLLLFSMMVIIIGIGSIIIPFITNIDSPIRALFFCVGLGLAVVGLSCLGIYRYWHS